MFLSSLEDKKVLGGISQPIGFVLTPLPVSMGAILKLVPQMMCYSLSWVEYDKEEGLLF